MSLDSGVAPAWFFTNALFKFLIGLDVLALAETLVDAAGVATQAVENTLPKHMRAYFKLALQWVLAYDRALGWLQSKGATVSSDVSNVENMGEADPSHVNTFFLDPPQPQLDLQNLVLVYKEIINAMRCNHPVPANIAKVPSTASLVQYASRNVDDFTSRFNQFMLPTGQLIALRSQGDDAGVAFRFVVPDGLVVDCLVLDPPSFRDIYTVVGSRVVGLPIALERNLFLDLATLDLSSAKMLNACNNTFDPQMSLLEDLRTILAGSPAGFRLGLHADFSPSNVASTMVRNDREFLDELHENFIELVAQQRPICNNPESKMSVTFKDS